MTQEKSSDGDRGQLPYIVAVAVVGGIGTIVMLLAVGARAGWSVALGAGIAVLNLIVLTRMVKVFLSPQRPSRGWMGLGFIKVALLAAAMYLPPKAGFADLLWMLLGFGALPLGILLGQMFFVDPATREN